MCFVVGFITLKVDLIFKINRVCCMAYSQCKKMTGLLELVFPRQLKVKNLGPVTLSYYFLSPISVETIDTT